MGDLGSFGALVKQAALEKKNKQDVELLRRNSEITPLLSELFSSVSTAKVLSANAAKTNKPLLDEFKSALLNPEKFVKESPVPIKEVVKIIETLEIEAKSIEEKVITDDHSVSNQEKRFLKLFNRLQSDFQTLKKYVETKSSSYSGTSGSGEVRILRMDDMEKGVTPSNGDTLVWSSALNKFELKQQIASDGSLGTIITDEEMPYAKRVDFVNDNELYKGEAVVGSLVSTSVWRIRKIVISIDGDVSETWADGNSNYDNSWANRLTYTYR